jgi:hypothetical protein
VEVSLRKHFEEVRLLKTIALIILLFGTLNVFPGEVGLSPEEKMAISSGEVIVRKVPVENTKGETYEAIGLIKANMSAVLDVLMDFENQSAYMPNVKEVETVESKENSAVLNYTLGFPLGITRKYRLLMTYQKEEGQALLQWRKLDWPELQPDETITDTKGYWLLREFPEEEGGILAVYHVYTDPNPIPLGLGWIARLLTKEGLPDVVSKTRARVYEVAKRTDSQ